MSGVHSGVHCVVHGGVQLNLIQCCQQCSCAKQQQLAKVVWQVGYRPLRKWQNMGRGTVLTCSFFSFVLYSGVYLILIYNFNADDEFYFPVQHDLRQNSILFFSFNQVRFRLILTIFSFHDPPKGVPNGVGALQNTLHTFFCILRGAQAKQGPALFF